jgi:outer membrane translocation and assembly module TamA
MRIIVTLLFAAIAAAGSQQVSSDVPVTKIVIDNLLIQSRTLPDQDRLSLKQGFGHKSFDSEELQDRIRQATRDLGYFRSAVSTPVLSNRKQINAISESDVTVEISAGPQYHVGQIYFQDAQAFPESELESAFAMHPGDLFSPTTIGKGLEALRALYGTKGYIDFVVTPVLAIDESAHTISLHLDFDEGSVVRLGDLLLEGYEVHAGAATALRNSWTALKGERFDPRLLDRWLQANQKDCPGCIRERNMSFHPANLKPKTVDVLLSMQQP